VGRISKLSILICGVMLLTFVFTARSDEQSGQWLMAGHDLNNTFSAQESLITAASVSSLTPKWVFVTGSDVSATPTVANDAVYFPDWSGNLYGVSRSDGKLIWSHAISDYDGFPGALSRVSPAIHGDDLILGDLESATVVHNGANVMAVNRATGKLHWITQVDKHPAAIITGSPVFLGDVIYVGVSSSEEALAVPSSYPCCSFRGSMVALDARNGEILWQTFIVPDNAGRPDGYSGGAIWQPPAIDQKRGLLFTGTGNNYEVPDSVKQCLSISAPDLQANCFPRDDHFDSALALDLKTGSIKWASRLQGVDVWTVACSRNPNPVSCPLPSSPDYDLSGAGPNLFANSVGFGQKSGIYWMLNADSGKLVWSSVVGPGSTLGGMEWGTATDGTRIFAAITNAGHKGYQLIDGTTTSGGAWSALDATTGRILWQTADPVQAIDVGALSVANGVVYAPSFSGNFHALDAATGKVLWTFASGGSAIDAPSIVNGFVFWGSGYKKIQPGTTNNKVYAFTVTQPN
jgi:polyvinyl alcohol dehydrogenase (cytochrome)